MRQEEVTFTVEAENDITEIAIYLGADSAKVADGFLDEIDATTKRLVRTPKIGAIWRHGRLFDDPDLNDIHMMPIGKPFDRYFVFYRSTGAGVFFGPFSILSLGVVTRPLRVQAPRASRRLSPKARR